MEYVKGLGGVIEVVTVSSVNNKCDKCCKDVSKTVIFDIVDKDDEDNTLKTLKYCEKCFLKLKVSDELKNNVSRRMRAVIELNKQHEIDLIDVLKTFKEIEDEDKKIFKEPQMFKVTEYINMAKSRTLIYSEEELYEYVNFYGNDIDIVTKLRSLAFSSDNDLYKRYYRLSRIGELSHKNLATIKKLREMSYLDKSMNEFWNNLNTREIMVNEMNDSNVETCNNMKISTALDIIEFSKRTDIVSQKQAWFLNKMFKNYGESEFTLTYKESEIESGVVDEKVMQDKVENSN